MIKIKKLDHIKTLPEASTKYDCSIFQDQFNLFFQPKQGSKELYVFFNGPLKEGSKPDSFQRYKVARELDANCLHISDPIHYKEDTSCGWYVGRSNYNFQIVVRKIIERFRDLLELSNTEITLIGASSGGFAAIAVGALLKESKTIAINPHTIIKKAKGAALTNLLSTQFGGISEEDFHTSYPLQANVSQVVTKHNKTQSITIIQDSSKTANINSHIKPFAKKFKLSSEETSSNGNKAIHFYEPATVPSTNSVEFVTWALSL